MSKAVGVFRCTDDEKYRGIVMLGDGDYCTGFDVLLEVSLGLLKRFWSQLLTPHVTCRLKR
jgi:hypothetical protein